jgi:hypothetical protein
VVRSCENGNGISVCIKDGEFIEYLSFYQLIMEDSAP